jgi:hypothetical protein
MTTVLDAFVVEIGLDPKQFTRGQREALDSFKKTQEEALKGGKSIEEQSKKSMDALGGIKIQAVELFAVFAGGKSAVEFFGSIVKGDAAVGRLSRGINLSADAISRWQGVARVFGGTAEGMAQSFTAVSDAVAGWKMGDVSPLIARFRELSTAGGTVIDVNKGVDQTFLDMADNLKAIHDRDPATAGFMARRLGLDPGLADLMFQGSAAVQQMLDKVNKLGPATKEATDAAGDLEKRWNSIGVKADAVGRKVLNSGVGARITGLADELNKPISEAKPWDAIFGWGAYATGALPAPAAPFGGGSRGDRNNNPGNMKDGAFARSHGATGNDGGFAVFPDWATGSAAQAALVRGSSYRGLTLDQFAQKYAEGSSAWRNTVGGALGIGGRDIVNNQDPRMIDAIRRAEGTGAHGWGAYRGAANTGIGAWAGIDRGAGGSTTSSKIDINGPINIYPPPGTDGAAMASKFTETLKRQSFAAQANDGQN